VTAAEIVAALQAEGVKVEVTDRGSVACEPPPSPALLGALRTHKAEVLALLSLPLYQPGPCAEAAGCDADGFGWQLPNGLVRVLDAAGRFCGWMLDPAWKPPCLDIESPTPAPVCSASTSRCQAAAGMAAYRRPPKSNA